MAVTYDEGNSVDSSVCSIYNDTGELIYQGKWHKALEWARYEFNFAADRGLSDLANYYLEVIQALKRSA